MSRSGSVRRRSKRRSRTGRRRRAARRRAARARARVKTMRRRARGAPGRRARERAAGGHPVALARPLDELAQDEEPLPRLVDITFIRAGPADVIDEILRCSCLAAGPVIIVE